MSRGDQNHHGSRPWREEKNSTEEKTASEEMKEMEEMKELEEKTALEEMEEMEEMEELEETETMETPEEMEESTANQGREKEINRPVEEDSGEEAYASMAWTANGGWTASSAIPRRKWTNSKEKEEEGSNHEEDVDTE